MPSSAGSWPGWRRAMTCARRCCGGRRPPRSSSRASAAPRPCRRRTKLPPFSPKPPALARSRMHIPPHDNGNRPIVGPDHPLVPLNYFNIVRLSRGEWFDYAVAGYETCIVPATGSVRVEVAGEKYDDLGGRGADVWDGEPEGVYV